jgi:hypothetical protein
MWGSRDEEHGRDERQDGSDGCQYIYPAREEGLSLAHLQPRAQTRQLGVATWQPAGEDIGPPFFPSSSLGFSSTWWGANAQCRRVIFSLTHSAVCIHSPGKVSWEAYIDGLSSLYVCTIVHSVYLGDCIVLAYIIGHCSLYPFGFARVYGLLL